MHYHVFDLSNPTVIGIVFLRPNNTKYLVPSSILINPFTLSSLIRNGLAFLSNPMCNSNNNQYKQQLIMKSCD